MNLFKTAYTLRRYSEKEWVNGLPSAGYNDTPVLLDVQPQGDRASWGSDGQQIYRNLRVFCDTELHPADPQHGIDADRILVNGIWYECKEAFYWRNSILHHYDCVFSAVEQERMNDDT